MSGNLYGVVDLGGTTVKWSLFDPTSSKLTAEPEERPTPSRTTTSDAFLEGFEEANVSFRAGNVTGVGVSSPRPFRRDAEGKTWLHNTPNLAISLNADGYPIQAELESLFGVPVTVKHDGGCNALAEMEIGVARDWTNFGLLINGTGIGYSAVQSGAVVEDENGNGPEPCFVVPPGSDTLNINELTAGPAITAKFGRITTDEQRAAAAEWCAKWQQIVIGPWIEQYEAEHLVMTGGVTDVLGEFYVDVLVDALRPYGLKDAFISSLGRDVGLIGAGISYRIAQKAAG